jgi:hypothetical protein
MFTGNVYNGSWTRQGNTFTLIRADDGSELGTATLLTGNLFVTFRIKDDTDEDILHPSYIVGSVELYKNGVASGTTKLKINNLSSFDLTSVTWQDISFANGDHDDKNSLTKGTSVTQIVQANTGYIYFTRKTNPIVARTRDLVIVEEKETGEFTFTDNTVIVEVGNTSNTGTLGSIQSTQ